MLQEKIVRVGDSLTLEEAARIKGVNIPTLYRWLYRNGVSCRRVGRSLLVRETDIEKYIPRQRRK